MANSSAFFLAAIASSTAYSASSIVARRRSRSRRERRLRRHRLESRPSWRRPAPSWHQCPDTFRCAQSIASAGRSTMRRCGPRWRLPSRPVCRPAPVPSYAPLLQTARPRTLPWFVHPAGVPSLFSSVYAKAHSVLASAGSSGVPSGRSSLKVNTTYRPGVTIQAGSSSL
jgi:hypothetical protein